MSSDSKFQVSMFQIPEQVRLALVRVSGQSVTQGKKKSMNTCILEALESYFSKPPQKQAQPELPKGPLRNFTVRTTAEMKIQLGETAAYWQVELGCPITMNAVLNTALLGYLKEKLPEFELGV
jgi:hypothetical protein